MADRTHTTRYEVEDASSAALATIRTETQGLREDFVAGALATFAFKEGLDDANTAFDEVEDKIRDARNRMVEFGFSNKEVAAGLDLIVAGSEALGEPIALTALRIEELAKETQSAKQTFELFGLATEIVTTTGERIETATALTVQLHRETGSAAAATQRWAEAQELAARTGQRATDALSDLNQVARGSTATLRDLSNRGKLVADAIDKISDPSLRARVALAETRKEMRRGQTQIERLGDDYQLLQVKLARMGPAGRLVKGGFLAAAAGATALVGITTKLSKDALAAYISTSPRAKRESEKLKTASDALEASFGGVLAAVFDVDDGLEDLTGTTKAMTASLNDAKDDIAAVTTGLISFNETIGDAIGPVTGFIGKITTLLKQLSALAAEIKKVNAAANAGKRDADRKSDRTVDRLTHDLMRSGPSEETLAAYEGAVAAGIKDGSIPLDIEGRPFVTVTFDDDGGGFQLDTSRQDNLALVEGFKGIVPDPDLIDRKTKKKGSGGGGSGKKEDATPFNPTPLGPGRGEDGLSADDIVARSRTESARINHEAVRDAKASIERLKLEDVVLQLRFVTQAQDIDAIKVRLDKEVRPLTEAITEFKTAANGGLDPSIPEDTERLIEQYQRSTELIYASDQAFTDMANGGLSLAINRLADFSTQLFAGTADAENFATGTLKAFGGLFKTTGTGLILLGLATASLSAGIPDPLALVGWGTGLTVAGAGVEGFMSRGSGGGSGTATASAVQAGFVQSQDQLSDSLRNDRPLEVFVTQEGIKRMVAKSVNEGVEDNSILFQ